MKITQSNAIRSHLEDGKSITALDALNLYGCLRLAARISDLKKLGLDIDKKMVSNNGSTFASYFLKV